MDQKKHVLIEVFGGIASVAECPDDVEVTIKDYDNEGPGCVIPGCLSDEADQEGYCKVHSQR